MDAFNYVSGGLPWTYLQTLIQTVQPTGTTMGLSDMGHHALIIKKLPVSFHVFKRIIFKVAVITFIGFLFCVFKTVLEVIL